MYSLFIEKLKRNYQRWVNKILNGKWRRVPMISTFIFREISWSKVDILTIREIRWWNIDILNIQEIRWWKVDMMIIREIRWSKIDILIIRETRCPKVDILIVREAMWSTVAWHSDYSSDQVIEKVNGRVHRNIYWFNISVCDLFS